MNKRCSVKDCGGKPYVRGYCKKHYVRWQRYRDPLKVANERHGLRHSPEYGVWTNMKTRCYNKNNKGYSRYGGRGIAVCERWKNSFSAFYADMGARPTNKHTLERVDSNKDYCPENVIWATWTINIRNRKYVKLDMKKAILIRDYYKRKVYIQKELAIKFGVSARTIGRVIRHTTWENVA